MQLQQLWGRVEEYGKDTETLTSVVAPSFYHERPVVIYGFKAIKEYTDYDIVEKQYEEVLEVDDTIANVS